MDKKDGGTIDLESLRGFTPGPWSLGEDRGQEIYVSSGPEPRMRYSGWNGLATVYGSDDDPDAGREPMMANARLIAAAPSMHAELTARRARDAEVEALVAAAHRAEVSFNTVRGCYERNPGNFMLAMNELEADVLPLRAAIATFTGSKP